MKSDLIAQDWDALAGRRAEFTRSFYASFFERYSEYRSLFPPTMDAQMERMVELFSTMARFANQADVVAPYLKQVGFAHRNFGIRLGDAERFRDVFIDTLADMLAATWNEEHSAAWRAAFDDMLLPMFDEGLSKARGDR